LCRLSWFVLLFGSNINININVSVNIFDAVFLAFTFCGRLDLRIIKCILLLSLSLQLFPEVLLLLLGQSLKQLAVPHLLVSIAALQITLIFRLGWLGVFLFLLPEGTSDFHIHVLDMLVFAHLGSR